MLSRLLFVDVPENGTVWESCTPNGTVWEFSQLGITTSEAYVKTYERI